ncbi:MAG: sugar phosphate isomerase/epimerase family protein, partial [Planctomycetota bacterium]
IEIAPFTLGGPVDGPIAHCADVTTIPAERRTAIAQAAAAAGLDVVGLHWLFAGTEGFHLTSPDSAVRERTAGYLEALAELCADLGGSVLVLGSPQQRRLLGGVDLATANDYAIEVLGRAMPRFEKLGLTLALEPLGPEEVDFMNTADDAARLIERLGSDACRLHLDMKAMSTEATPVDAIIGRHIGVAAHVHANDPNRLGPGMGDFDFAAALASLSSAGYDGWVSVEVFRYEPSPDEIATVSLRNLREATTAGIL